MRHSDPAGAGKWREEPVWIGTSSSSPVGADFVAPDARRVPELMEDLMSYAARNDVQILAQAAIAHAQFETIHPFTDGNGSVAVHSSLSPGDEKVTNKSGIERKSGECIRFPACPATSEKPPRNLDF